MWSVKHQLERILALKNVRTWGERNWWGTGARIPWDWVMGGTLGWCLDWGIPPLLPKILWAPYDWRWKIKPQNSHSKKKKEKKPCDCTKEANVKVAGQKQEERLSYLSKGDSVVEEGMGIVDSGWWVQRARTLLPKAPILIGQSQGLSMTANGRPIWVGV